MYSEHPRLQVLFSFLYSIAVLVFFTILITLSLNWADCWTIIQKLYSTLWYSVRTTQRLNQGTANKGRKTKRTEQEGLWMNSGHDDKSSPHFHYRSSPHSRAKAVAEAMDSCVKYILDSGLAVGDSSSTREQHDVLDEYSSRDIPSMDFII